MFYGVFDLNYRIIVNFSGGLSSARMTLLARELFGKDRVENLFCDTGAEHPETYNFIRKCNDQLGLNITCLRGVFDTPLKSGNNYQVGGVDIIGPDLKPFEGCMRKYGTPYAPSGGMCSTRMKEEIATAYCRDRYGLGNYDMLIGIRFDEPKRLVGDALHVDKSNYKILSRYAQLSDDDISQLYRDMFFGVDSDILDDLKVFQYGLIPTAISRIEKTIAKRKHKRIFHMALLWDYSKQDVNDFWGSMPFTLGIDEHLGNCVFCIKKSVNKVALAARDEPEMMTKFIEIIEQANPRNDLPHRPPKEIMYRGKNTLQSLVDKFADYTRDEIAETLRSTIKQESGTCSESCNGFEDDSE